MNYPPDLELAGKVILVTGANGFIGSRLVARLVEQCHAHVRAMVRKLPQSGTSSLLPREIEFVSADVTDPVAIHRAMDGCEIVIHTAALQPFAPLPRRAEFFAVNVGGTENLMRAFGERRQGERFVLLSTINVHGLPPPANANADSPLVLSGDRYSDSKADAERAAWRLSVTDNIPLTVIRPGCTYGPGSRAWTLQPIERLKHGVPLLVGSGDGICNAVYVDNLIDLIISALVCSEARGQAFIGTDGIDVTWRAFFGYYARMLNLPLRSMPLLAARAFALASGTYERITGTPGRLSPSSLAFYTHHTTFDVEKNERVLKQGPRVDLNEGMRLTEEWLRGQEILAPVSNKGPI